MNFYRDADVPRDTQGFWCRQSRFAGLVRFVVFGAGLAIAPVVGWKSDRPWVLWSGLILAALFIPVLVKDVAALFRAKNWVLQIGNGGLWINLRSYRVKVSDVVSVLHLGFAEIASVGRHTESYSTPRERVSGPGGYGAVGGSIAWKDEYLEIRLNHAETDELVAALQNAAPRADSGRAPAARLSGRSRSFSVWRVSPAVLRIPWISGHGAVVVPRIAQVLARLDGNVPVDEPTRRDRPNWRKLSAKEVQELARDLVQVHDATLDATTLLVRAGGLPYAQATALVHRFEQEGTQVLPRE